MTLDFLKPQRTDWCPAKNFEMPCNLVMKSITAGLIWVCVDCGCSKPMFVGVVR